MVNFLIQILVNTLAVSLAIWLLPGIEINSNRLLIYPLLGFGFGLLNGVIKPIIIFFTTGLVIRTLGLFMLVVNALVLILLSLISNWFLPDLLTITSWLALIFAGVLIGLIITLLDIFLGLNRPVMEEIEQNAFYWGWLQRLSSGRRNRVVENLRFQEVYDTLWRYGLQIAGSQGWLGNARAFVEQIFARYAGRVEIPSTPAQVRIMLQQLGPTYVKIGQMISSQAESLPPEWVTELSKLQSSVPPFPTTEAQALIQEDLDDSVENLFASFEERPLAAASTAQVHRAVLHSGEEVVVKVQRPNTVTKVGADLHIIQDGVAAAARRFEWARHNNIDGIVNEFAINVIRELNYDNELYNGRRLQKLMASIPSIHVPDVYGALSSSRVLTMEYVKGVKITDTLAMDRAGVDRKVLAKEFLRAMVKQLIVDGFFHSDPHPGNVLVDLETSQIVFLDMGMMGELTSAQRLDFADMLWAILEQDSYSLAQVVMRLSTRFKDEVDEASFQRAMERMVDRFLVYAEETDSLSRVITATMDAMYEHGLRFHSSLTLAIKTLAQAEEIVFALDREMSMVTVAFEAVKDLMVEQINFENIADAAKKQAVRTVKDVARQLPDLQTATMSWIEQYRQGQLEVHLNTGDLNKEVEKLNRGVEWLTIALLLGGMMGGSAIAVSIPTSIGSVPLSTVAFFTFMASILLSVVLVVRLLWRR